MMIKIREYTSQDSTEVGRLIAKTYSEINLAFLPPEQRGPFLGPFQYAESDNPDHQETIARLIQAPMVFIAENDRRIVGVLRGSPGRLHSLFVEQARHQQGIGRKLLQHFEAVCVAQKNLKITLASTLHAVPFYEKMGYKKSTGLRKGWSFEGEGFLWQPMKKVLHS